MAKVKATLMEKDAQEKRDINLHDINGSLEYFCNFEAPPRVRNDKT